MSASKSILRLPLRIRTPQSSSTPLLSLPLSRHLSSTAPRLATDPLSNSPTDALSTLEKATSTTPKQPQRPPRKPTANLMSKPTNEPTAPPTGLQALSSQINESLILAQTPPHRLYSYSHRHNTHLTLTTPTGQPLISLSTGNIGFKKGGRGSFDAAYQLTAFVLTKIQEKGLIPKIRTMELILRGFGPGREAVSKALLGTEGMNVRKKIVRVSDATRLKQGGARSAARRRLG